MFRAILETFRIPNLFAEAIRDLGRDLEVLFARLRELEGRGSTPGNGTTRRGARVRGLSQRARLRKTGRTYRRTSLAIPEDLRAQLEAEVSRRRQEGRATDLGQLLRESAIAYLEGQGADQVDRLQILPVGEGRPRPSNGASMHATPIPSTFSN